MKALPIVGVVLIVLVAVALIGLRVQPKAWAVTGQSTDLGQVQLQADLPAPVARYAEKVAAHGMPRVASFAVGGTGVMRRGPLTMPLRWHAEHRPGEAFVRDLEVTWFGLPVIKGLDVWQHGEGKMVIAGSATTGPELDQGANMAAWGEAGWAPSFQLSDPRIRWETVDDTHARMVFPFEGGEDSLLYAFDPRTDLPTEALGMRYKAGAGGAKVGWIVRNLGWQTVSGTLVPTRVDVKWADEARPWLELHITDVAINVPVPKLEAE